MPNFIQPKKEITLDDLAAMCMREFRAIHERLDRMETRIDSIEGRLDSMDGKIMATKADLAKFEKKMDKRFDRIETILADHTARIGRLEKVVFA